MAKERNTEMQLLEVIRSISTKMLRRDKLIRNNPRKLRIEVALEGTLG